MHLTRLRAFAAAFLAATLLSACATDAAKTAPPPPSPQPTSPVTSKSPSSDPTTTATSNKTRQVTPSVAILKTAAKAYFGAYNEAIRLRDTTAFRQTFTNGCKICSADADDLDKDVDLGQSLHGGRYHMTGGKLIKAVQGSGLLFFSLRQDPSTLVDSAGRTLTTYQSSVVPSAYLEFTWINHKWIATGSVVG